MTFESLVSSLSSIEKINALLGEFAGTDNKIIKKKIIHRSVAVEVAENVCLFLFLRSGSWIHFRWLRSRTATLNGGAR